MLQFAKEKERKQKIQKQIDKKQKRADKVLREQKKEEVKNREKFNEKRINIFNKIHEAKKLEEGHEIAKIEEYKRGWEEKLKIVESLQQEKNEMAKRYLQQQKIQR